MGDSERRQVDDAKKWADQNGYTLDQSLNLTDRGFSGYHGDHRTKGALGKFLAKVEAGAIPTGSILLVENVDRLSREGAVKVLREVIFKLWDHGITLHTLSPDEAYPPGCEAEAKFLALLIYIQRAQDESEQKSRRIRKARETARRAAHEEKKILTSRAPAWLEVKDDKFVAIPEAKKAVRLIFDLKLKGLSIRAIERKLNELGAWTPPQQRRSQRTGGWRASYIKKILNNRVVIGEYQPFHKLNGTRRPIGEAIEGYFPVVVPPHKFHAAQKLMAQNKGSGGRADKFNNVLKNLGRCAYCGGPMRFDCKGQPPKGGRYLVCYNGERNADCRHPGPYRIRYEDVLNTVLDNCPKLKPEQVLPNPDEQAARCQSLGERIAGLHSELADLDRKQNNLADLIADEDDKDIRQRLRDKLHAIQQKRPGVEDAIATSERELQLAEKDAKSFNQWKSGLAELRKGIDGTDKAAVELRMQFNSHLRELIDRIEVFAEGYQKPYDVDDKDRRTDTDDFEEATIELIAEHDRALAKDKLIRSFVKHVAQLRLTKRGRFVRVHFTTGSTVDLVPDGSLASGMEMVHDARRRAGWRFVSPRLDRMWRDYRTANKKG